MTGTLQELKDTYRNRPLLMTGLTMLVIGLPLSLFLTSLSQFFLAGSFFLEGSFIDKFKRFFSQPVAMAIAAIWILHVIGLGWTEDMASGIKDVKVKLPLLTLPVILAGSDTLDIRQYKTILRLFVGAVLTGSLISMSVLAGIIHVPMDDIRDIFIFKISHIRFALFVCLSIVICITEGLQINGGFRLVSFMIAGWLTVFLVIIESMTGIGILVLIGVFSGIRWIAVSKFRRFGWGLLLACGAGGLWLTADFNDAYLDAARQSDEPMDFEALTKEGRKYYFDTTQNVFENGHRVWAYVCDPELKREWNKRSRTPYDSDNELYQPVRTCLIRFMSSKGLRKDAEGLNRLSYEEITAVEQGVANVDYIGISGFRRRIKETAWEFVQFKNGLDPNDHSFTQRLEYWNTAAAIIRQHPILGVGTGDLQRSFNEYYDTHGSRLRPENRLRTHNQFIALAVGIGTPVALFFIAVMIYLLISGIRQRNLLFVASWIILMLSMITEDSLETQPGATFFAASLMITFFSRPADRQNQSTTSR
ncbi:MAG: O-antigen ligase family protein [Bacteroidota bacterium]